MKIFLVGLLGSGKSNLGKKVAQSLRLPFIDLDVVIENQLGMPVSKIFTSKGEEYFRNIEAAALRVQSEQNEFVMATGGGTPCFHNNITFINQTGKSIFLNTPIQTILKRMNSAEKSSRPLLSNVSDDQMEQVLQQMLNNRISYYQQAHFTLNGDTATPWDVVQLVTKSN